MLEKAVLMSHDVDYVTKHGLDRGGRSGIRVDYRGDVLSLNQVERVAAVEVDAIFFLCYVSGSGNFIIFIEMVISNGC